MAFVAPPLTPLAGGRPPRCASAADGRLAPDAAVDIVVTVRSRNLSRGLGWVNRQAWWAPAHRARLTRRQCIETHGAADHDLAAVRASLASWGLECALEDSSDRLVHAVGTVAAMEQAFGVTLQLHDGGHRGRTGAIALPPRMVGVVRALTGLDTCTTLRPSVEPGLSRRATATRAHLEKAWGLPSHLVGEGACVAITVPAELEVAELVRAGLPEDVAVLGASLGAEAGRDWASATVAQVHAVRLAAPSARIVVHAGRGGESGAIDTLAAAIHDSVNAPQVVVAGWGAPEAEWTPQAMLAIEQRFLAASAMGVTVVCAAPGDAAVFPASAPHALGCAPLVARARSKKGSTAASAVFPTPAWQAAGDVLGTSARRVPDVLTPAVIRLPGGEIAAGPAIAAALCAGALAALGEVAGAPLGYVQPLLLGDAETAAPAEPDLAALIHRFDSAVPTTVAPAPFGSRAHPPAIRGRRHG